jgi:hypothetical protein
MVTSAEEKEIQTRMRRIKDAKDDEGKTDEDIKRRTQELMSFLRKRGIVNDLDG